MIFELLDANIVIIIYAHCILVLCIHMPTRLCQVPKWQFIIIEKPQVGSKEAFFSAPMSSVTYHGTASLQVESDHNFGIILEFLAGFAHDCMCASTTPISVHIYSLNSISKYGFD